MDIASSSYLCLHSWFVFIYVYFSLHYYTTDTTEYILQAAGLRETMFCHAPKTEAIKNWIIEKGNVTLGLTGVS